MKQSVIPAQAGIQPETDRVPACAGTTTENQAR